MGRDLLAYCATPSRLARQTDEIMDFVGELGLAPFHPFKAFPLEHYENGRLGRDKSMDCCFAAVEFCPYFFLFGVSHGTLQEVRVALQKGKKIILVDGFDPEREEFYRELGHQYKNPLDGLTWTPREQIRQIVDSSLSDK